MEEQLRILQDRLATVDFLTQPRRISSDPAFELLLKKIQRLKLKMYNEQNHAMPHLHVDYGRDHHVASYTINPAKRLLKGALDTKYDKEIVGWITGNKEALLTIWSSLRSGGDPTVIIGDLTE